MKRAWLGCVLIVLLAAGDAAAAKPVDLCVDAYDKGQVLRDERRLRDARTQFVACSRDECPTALRRDCLVWLEQIGASLGSLVFRVVDADGRDLSLASIFVDGELVASRLEGWAVPVEPGPRTVRAEVPGEKPIEQTVVIAEGEKNRPIILRLVREGPPSRPPPAPLGGPPPPSPSLPTVTYVTGAAAIAGLGVFGVFGIMGTLALSKLHNECAVTRRCTSDDVDDVQRTLVIGDIAGAAGLVALGVTTFLLVDHLRTRRAAPKTGWLRPAAGFAF